MTKYLTLSLLALLVSFAAFAVGPITGTTTTCVGTTTTLADTTSGGSWSSGSTGTATVGITSGVVTGVSAGTAVISYLKGTSLATITVSVTASPTIYGPSAVCAGSTITLTDATPGGTWSVGSSAVATVSSGGIVTGASAGVTNIYYSAGGCYAYHTVTVTGGASSISGASTVCAGSTITLSDASSGGSWSSNNTTIATAGITSGIVTGVSAGTATIYYLVGGCYAYHTVTVTGGSSISGPKTVCTGSTITLSDATSGGAYFSGNTSVATINATSGVVTGVSAGTDTIYYSLGGCYALYTITVTGGASISGPSTVCVGSTITLSDATSGGTWTTGSSSVATVSSGVVTGVGAGVTNIYYLVGGCYAIHTVTVSGGSSISGPTTVCAGSTMTLSDVSSGGSYFSGNTAIATVNATSGVVTGISAGTDTIYYSLHGCYALYTVTVTGGATIYGPSTVCAGSTITLSDATSGGTWAVGSSAIATVSSGVVTGVSSGVTNIYYSVGGCTAYHTVTVTGGSSSIYGPTTVCAGSTVTLTDATSGGTWTSSNSSVATAGITSGIITGVSAGTATIYYLAGGCYAYHTVTVTGGASIYGPSTVCAGSTITLSDATSGGTWAVGSSAIATVSSGGIVTGVSAGVTNIYYSVGGCYAYHTVTVTGGASISGPSTVCAGSAITLSDAISGGSWSSNNTSIATAGITSGIITGVSAGTATIYYIVGGCYSFHTVTVTGGASISGPSTLCVGSTITLSDATSGGTWAVGSSAIATVSSGVVTGVSAGVTNIYYSVGGCYAYHTVTVSGGSTISGPTAVCVGSTITLSDASSGGGYFSGNTAIATINATSGVVTGVSAGTDTIYYSLHGCYALYTITVTGAATIYGPSTVCAGSTIILSDATSGGTWAVGSSSIATVSSGIVTGVSAGVTNIYYSVGGCFAYHTVTVTGGASISGPSTVCAGSTITLSDATSGGSWSSNNTSIATAGITSGIVTGVSAGTATIYYLVGGCYAYHTVTVTGGASSISGASTVCSGSTITLSDATSGGSWSSSNTSIATAGITSGVITGVSAGVVNIYYFAGGCYAYHTVTVTGGPSISGPSAVCVGSTITLSDGTSGGSWSSSNTAIATAGITSGVVTGVSAGTATIYYSVSGCYAYHTVTVSGGSSISGPTTVCAGSTITLSDASSGGAYFSGNTAIATINATSGLLTGVSAGIDTIYYSLHGCYALYTVTVTGGASIYGPSTVCVGSTITLSDATSGGTWAVGSSAVATVSSGVVTGASAGVTNIYYSVSGCYAYHTVTVIGGASITGPSTVCAGSTITLSDATSGGSWSSNNTSIAIAGITSGVVTGVSAGTATIYYLKGGCYANYTVTVNPTPSAITGLSKVYIDSVITLTDTTAGGTWISGNLSFATIGSTSGIVTGVATGVLNIYYVIGSCGVYHTVTVTPAPPGGISGLVISGAGKGTSTGVPVTGLLVNLKDTANNVLASVSTDGTGSYAFTALADGSYIVDPVDTGYTTTTSAIIAVSSTTENVTNINFIEYTGSKTIVPLVTTGVKPVSAVNSISVYPNPTNGDLNIKWNNQEAGNADVVITDVTGREVFKSVLNINTTSGQSQIGLSELKTGIYLLTIKSDNIYYTAKLMIQK